MTRQTATEISNAIIAQLETSLNTTIPLLPKSFCRVIAKALGGVFVLLYQFAGWILLQMFVKTASNEEITIGGITLTPLKMWGSLVGIFQYEGQRAEHTISIDVITPGGSLTSGTRVVNPETEMVYTLVNDVTLQTPPALTIGTIRATESGDVGNVDASETLQFVSPPSAVEKEVTVITRTIDGVDAQETEDFRQQILDRFAARPQGGAYADYRDWAEEIVGVKNAYPYSGWYDLGLYGTYAGQVFVYIEDTTSVDGIPTALTNGRVEGLPGEGVLLTSVFNNIESDSSGLANRRNINAYLKVYPISRTTFDVEISGLAADDISAAQTAIEDGLTDYFLDRGPYITGLTIPPRRDVISDTGVGGYAGQLAEAQGGTISGVVVSTGGSPLVGGIYYLQEGEKSKLGGVSWT